MHVIQVQKNVGKIKMQMDIDYVFSNMEDRDFKKSMKGNHIYSPTILTQDDFTFPLTWLNFDSFSWQ